ncbi:MAG: hypothetical protein IPK82_21135 [Polyangiaceae bacterium]|nr:hypothetical protein [Polyangiaceae bacterium]
MSEKQSTWGKSPIADSDDEKSSVHNAKKALQGARSTAAELGEKAAAGVKPVATAVGNRVRSGLGKVGDALSADAGDEARIPAELLHQADLPELSTDDALASLAKRLDSEADFWRNVAMRQLARAAWTERLGVISSLLLLIGGVVLAAIAAFRALFAGEGSGLAVALLLGIGLVVLLIAAIAVGSLATKLRQGQVQVVRDAMARADLAETRLHRIALLMEMRTAARDGYTAALTGLETDVRLAERAGHDT